MQHHPVSAGSDCGVAIHVNIYSTASQQRHTVNGPIYIGRREPRSTNQRVDEGRVGFVRAQRQLRPERVGVVVEAYAFNALVASTEIAGNPKGLIEISCGSKVEAVEVSSPLDRVN